MTIAKPDVITRELRIAAKPETVFGLLAEGDQIARWMGRRAWAEPEPGGLLRIDYNGFDIMRGSFLEVVPHSKVVWGWGWESLSPANSSSSTPSA